MNENNAGKQRIRYYGEPEREQLEAISGNIGKSMPGHWSASVLCLRLKFEGLKFENRKLKFPSVCWEKMCTRNNEVMAIQPMDQFDDNQFCNQLDHMDARFGDFWQIIRELKPEVSQTGKISINYRQGSGGEEESQIISPENNGRTSRGNVYKASRFLQIFTNDDAYCLMHSLTQRKVFGGEVLGSLFAMFKKPMDCDTVREMLASTYPEGVLTQIIWDLKEKGLIVSGYDIDAGTYLSLFCEGINRPAIQHLYLLPTNDCNLRCRYCFLGDCAREFSPRYMTQDTAQKSLEIFAKLTEPAAHISITFYGGEPLLNADVVYFSMRTVRALEKQGVFRRPVELSLLTNATRVDDRTIEAVLDTNTSVSVSLDGPGELNGARQGADGNDTFRRALAGYRKLTEAGISPGISCTLNQYNASHIEEITRFIAEDLEAPGMGFNVLVPHTDGGNPVSIPPDYATDQIIRAFPVLREEGVYEDRMMRRVIPYRGSSFSLKDCMGVGGQIVITPDGRIGPCQAFLGYDNYFPFTVDTLHTRLPTLTSDDIYADPLFDEWNHRFPLNMKQCLDCPAVAVCGGGCPYASMMSKGSIWEIDERTCSQSKKIMEWMLWDTYDRLVAGDNP
jgi:uncharacterized protein